MLRLRDVAGRASLPVLVLGGGSNILAGDRGFSGLVVRLGGEFTAISVEGSCIHAGAGASAAALMKAAADSELAGLEFLAGLPGTVGGAVVGNAGAAEAWTGERITAVEVLDPDGGIRAVPAGEIRFSYRDSNLRDTIVLRASFGLKKGAKNDILEKAKTIMSRRSQSQPLGTFNAGCVFRNPRGDSAGRLIDAAGLKGFRFGGAQISEKHANFIINTGTATAADVRSLVSAVRARIRERFGCELELEIRLVGE